MKIKQKFSAILALLMSIFYFHEIRFNGKSMVDRALETNSVPYKLTIIIPFFLSSVAQLASRVMNTIIYNFNNSL